LSISAIRKTWYSHIEKRNHPHQVCQRKADARFLLPMLRETGLTLRSVRHRYRPTVNNLHVSALPQPRLGSLFTQQRVTLARQRSDHLLRQTLVLLAIAAGIHTHGIHTSQQATDEATRDTVRLVIHDYIWDKSTGLSLESFDEEEVDIRADDIFRHIYRAYPKLPSPYYASTIL